MNKDKQTHLIRSFIFGHFNGTREASVMWGEREHNPQV